MTNSAGSILPSTAVLIIPLTITIGAVVDYTNFTNKRDSVQNAADTAGIAAARQLVEIIVPESITTQEAKRAYYNEQLKPYAKKFFLANLDKRITPDEYTFDLNLKTSEPDPDSSSAIETKIEVSVDFVYDTIFGGIDGEDGGNLLNIDKIKDKIISAVSLGNRTVEIAMVLDNSGSMAFKAGDTSSQSIPASKSQQRMTLLKSETKKLVNSIFDVASGSTLPDPVKFSIVPFAGTVNVGKPSHINHQNGDNFLDTKGYTSYHNENLDWKNSYRVKSAQTVEIKNNNRSAVLKETGKADKYLTRFDVFDMMDMEWAGCVEMRPWPHNVTDSYSDNSSYSQSGSEKLFVPYMVPDEPDRNYSYYSNGRARSQRDSYYFGSSYIYDFYDYDADNNTRKRLYTNRNGAAENQYNNSQLNRTNWLFKYQAVQTLNSSDKPKRSKNTSRTDGGYFSDSGPNAYCPDQPLLQLTTNKTNVLNEVEAMIPHGGTNIQQGITWGWRTLSSAKPFTAGRDISDKENLKILILLTDGNNQQVLGATHNNTAYNSWGYQRTNNKLRHPLSDENTHGRLLEGTSQREGTIYDYSTSDDNPVVYTLDSSPDNQTEYEDLMNLHTNQACNNIKEDGITIYAIAFDVPANGKVRDLLKSCSGSGRRDNNNIISGVKFYHDVSGLELSDTFAEIASGISSIRIAQ